MNENAFDFSGKKQVILESPELWCVLSKEQRTVFNSEYSVLKNNDLISDRYFFELGMYIYYIPDWDLFVQALDRYYRVCYSEEK